MTAAATAPALERLALGSDCRRCGATTDEPCRTAAGRETRPHKARTDRAVEQYITAKRAAELDALPTTGEHGRVWPAFDGEGFVAAPRHSCAGCPSIGATLCNYAGESLTFPTREAAVEALAHHAEHGCADVSDADAPLVPGSPEWQAANGVVLIDPRTPLAPEHLADAAREVEVIATESTVTVTDTPVECSWCGQHITVVQRGDHLSTECGGEGEGGCDGSLDGDPTALRCAEAAITWAPGDRTMTDDKRAELVALVAAEYLVTAARNRADDLAAYVSDARDEPIAVADEYVMTAADLKVIASDALDYPDPDGLVAALREAGYRFAERVTVAELNEALALDHYRETLPHGTRVRHTNGDLGVIVGEVEVDAEGDTWVTVAFDGDETERRHPSTVRPVALPRR